VIVDKVTVRGAGPWYTVLGGRDPGNRSRAAGIYGRYAADGAGSRDVTVRDLAIIGDIRERVDNDQVNYNWNFGVGAIWFDGLNRPISGGTINVIDTSIMDSSYAAIHFIEGGTGGASFRNVTIDCTGTYAVQIQSPRSARFENVTATGAAQATPIFSCAGATFAITRAGVNTGWYAASPLCSGTWPAPVWRN
jgi:hypothetical protein